MVAAAAVFGGVPGNVVIRGPLALEVLCGNGTPRVFRSWAWAWGKRNEGMLGSVGVVSDLGGEALLDVVRVGGRGRGGGRGGGEGALGCRRRRRERVGDAGERLGLSVKGVGALVCAVVHLVHISFVSQSKPGLS